MLRCFLKIAATSSACNSQFSNTLSIIQINGRKRIHSLLPLFNKRLLPEINASVFVALDPIGFVLIHTDIHCMFSPTMSCA